MDFFGGGLVFAVAAALWIAYLIPSWIRRRNFVTTEQNAVRMQQTLRVLLETGDTPAEVEAELTARGIREQKKALRQAELAARARLRAAELEELRGSAEQRVAVAKHRVRGYRLMAFIFFAVSFLTVIAGIGLLSYTGSALALYLGLGGMVAGIVALRILVAVGRRVVVVADAPRVATPMYNFDLPTVASAPTRSWTPQPLPKPMHLQQGSLAQATVAQVSMAERIRQAAREEALRARMDEAASISYTRQIIARDEVLAPQAAAAPVAAPSLDIVDQLEASATASLNLDEVFRRRAAG